MGWWSVVVSAAKRIPWGSVLTFGAEKWLERRQRADEAARRTEPARPDAAPAPSQDPAARP